MDGCYQSIHIHTTLILRSFRIGVLSLLRAILGHLKEFFALLGIHLSFSDFENPNEYVIRSLEMVTGATREEILRTLLRVSRLFGSPKLLRTGIETFTVRRCRLLTPALFVRSTVANASTSMVATKFGGDLQSTTAVRFTGYFLELLVRTVVHRYKIRVTSMTSWSLSREQPSCC